MAAGDLTKAYMRKSKLDLVAGHLERKERTALLNAGFTPHEVEFLFSFEGVVTVTRARIENGLAILEATACTVSS